MLDHKAIDLEYKKGNFDFIGGLDSSGRPIAKVSYNVNF